MGVTFLPIGYLWYASTGMDKDDMEAYERF